MRTSKWDLRIPLVNGYSATNQFAVRFRLLIYNIHNFCFFERNAKHCFVKNMAGELAQRMWSRETERERERSFSTEIKSVNREINGPACNIYIIPYVVQCLPLVLFFIAFLCRTPHCLLKIKKAQNKTEKSFVVGFFIVISVHCHTETLTMNLISSRIYIIPNAFDVFVIN